MIYRVELTRASVLNRSQNPESIIGRVFDSIIDFKSIFRQDLSRNIRWNVTVTTLKILSNIFHKIVMKPFYKHKGECWS